MFALKVLKNATLLIAIKKFLETGTILLIQKTAFLVQN